MRRVRYQEHPPRDEYRLTDKGLDLWPVIVDLLHWGDAHAAGPEGPPVLLRHRDWAGDRLPPALRALRRRARPARGAGAARSGRRVRGAVAARSGAYNPGRMFDRIDHVGIVVADIDSAMAVYGETFALELVHREVVPEFGLELVLLQIGDSHVELLAQTARRSSFLAGARAGLHHVAYRVADIDATLAELTRRGVELIDKRPRARARATRGSPSSTRAPPAACSPSWWRRQA